MFFGEAESFFWINFCETFNHRTQEGCLHFFRAGFDKGQCRSRIFLGQDAEVEILFLIIQKIGPSEEVPRGCFEPTFLGDAPEEMFEIAIEGIEIGIFVPVLDFADRDRGSEGDDILELILVGLKAFYFFCFVMGDGRAPDFGAPMMKSGALFCLFE